MKRRKIYIILGLLVAIVPLLGFPSFVRTSLLVIAGLLIIVLAFTQRKRTTKEKRENKQVVNEIREEPTEE